MKKTLLITGASRGIGAAVASHFLGRGHEILAVSRTAPAAGRWLEADLSTPRGIARVAEAVGETSIDALLYMGGVWERNAFTGDYDFRSSPDGETRFVLDVNLVAPIEITKRIARNLAKAVNPRAIYIGALSGLDGEATPEVANTASKFGLRGAIQALRLALGGEKIGFTVINPGNVATDEVLADIEQGRFRPQTPIPFADVIATLEWILGLSSSVDVGEVDLRQK